MIFSQQNLFRIVLCREIQRNGGCAEIESHLQKHQDIFMPYCADANTHASNPQIGWHHDG